MQNTIRKANIEDYRFIDLLMKDLHNMHVKNRPDMYLPAEHVYSYDEFKEILEDDDKDVFVYVISEKVVGVCFITCRISTNNPIMVSDPIMYIEDIYVVEQYRTIGVGKELYKHVRDIAYARGCKRIELMVWGFNKNAIDFYTHMGMNMQRIFLEDVI